MLLFILEYMRFTQEFKRQTQVLFPGQIRKGRYLSTLELKKKANINTDFTRQSKCRHQADFFKVDLKNRHRSDFYARAKTQTGVWFLCHRKGLHKSKKTQVKFIQQFKRQAQVHFLCQTKKRGTHKYTTTRESNCSHKAVYLKGRLKKVDIDPASTIQ